MDKFLSNQRYRRDSLVDRERFAKFAIEETLGIDADDGFEVTGEIMKHESVAARSKPEVLDNLAKIINADGQQDVDAEVCIHSDIHAVPVADYIIQDSERIHKPCSF